MAFAKFSFQPHAISTLYLCWECPAIMVAPRNVSVPFWGGAQLNHAVWERVKFCVCLFPGDCSDFTCPTSPGMGADLEPWRQPECSSDLRCHECQCQHLCGMCPDVALAKITLQAVKTHLLNEQLWASPCPICVCACGCEDSCLLCVCACGILCGTSRSFVVCDHFELVCIPRELFLQLIIII